jgi:hypothetical protein
MSKKLNKTLAEQSKTHVIDDVEFSYLIDLDTIGRSFAYYNDQLKTNYLHQVALRLGYQRGDDLEFSIDTKSEKKELTIKVLPKE